jgi:hypothetical protein
MTQPIALPQWMRAALFATAVMNLAAAAAFRPAAAILRTTAGFPADAPPIYLRTVALFVGLFGLGYLYTAVRGRDERLFIAIAAVGKLGFVALVGAGWAEGSLPLRAPVVAAPDLVFSCLFFYWLRTSRG